MGGNLFAHPNPLSPAKRISPSLALPQKLREGNFLPHHDASLHPSLTSEAQWGRGLGVGEIKNPPSHQDEGFRRNALTGLGYIPTSINSLYAIKRNCRNALTGLGYIPTLAFFQVDVKINPAYLSNEFLHHASSCYLDACPALCPISPRNRQKKSKTPLPTPITFAPTRGGLSIVMQK